MAAPVKLRKTIVHAFNCVVAKLKTVFLLLDVLRVPTIIYPTERSIEKKMHRIPLVRKTTKKLVFCVFGIQFKKKIAMHSLIKHTSVLFSQSYKNKAAEQTNTHNYIFQTILKLSLSFVHALCAVHVAC